MEKALRQPVEKPMSVPEITSRAEDFDYNALVPLRYWLRTADTLLKEVRLSMPVIPKRSANEVFTLGRHI